MKNILQILIILLLPKSIIAQGIIPIDNEIMRAVDKQIIENGICPTNEKPYTIWQLKQIKLPELVDFNSQNQSNWFNRKLFDEHLFMVDSDNFKLSIDPAFNLQLKKQTTGNMYYTNSRGIRILCDLGNNFGFTSSFYENLSTFPEYYAFYPQQYRVVPGLGKMRKKGNTYDYSFVDAVFSIKINKYLFLTAGNGKLFVGQGYRSLILSDNAYGYPYLRLAFLAEKWQYTVTRCSLFDFGKKNLLSADFFQAFDRKSLAYHSLGFSPFKSINLSVFEAYIVSAGNTGWEFANPIIYVGSVNTSNKFALRGFSFNATICKQLLFYSQVVNSSNTLQAKNTAWQVGMQWYALGNLYFRTEYNEAGKNVYSNPDRLLQYTHYNQPLANAFGNGFNETVLVANANVKRWNLNYRLSFVKFAANYKPLIYYRYENFDKDWFTTQYTNAKSLQKHDVCLSYLINRAMNFKAEIGYSHRLFGNALFTSPGQYVYFTLKTSLGNMYDDY